MIAETSVGIHYDLSSCQSAVTQRPSHNKSACCVNMERGILVQHLLGNYLLDYLFNNSLPQGLIINFRIMLSGYNNGMDPFRFSINIFHCNL